MIFTKEQIKRLPGSTVRLRDYPNHKVVVGGLSEEFPKFASFRIPPDMRTSRDPTCFANTAKSLASSMDIVEVLQWADEKQTEPTSATLLGRAPSTTFSAATTTTAENNPIYILTISPSKDYHYPYCLSSAKCAADVPDIDRHWQHWLHPHDATATLEQLRDHHARIVEQLAREIYMQHVAKMKKAARLGVE